MLRLLRRIACCRRSDEKSFWGLNKQSNLAIFWLAVGAEDMIVNGGAWNMWLCPRYCMVGNTWSDACQPEVCPMGSSGVSSLTFLTYCGGDAIPSKVPLPNASGTCGIPTLFWRPLNVASSSHNIISHESQSYVPFPSPSPSPSPLVDSLWPVNHGYNQKKTRNDNIVGQYNFLEKRTPSINFRNWGSLWSGEPSSNEFVDTHTKEKRMAWRRHLVSTVVAIII